MPSARSRSAAAATPSSLREATATFAPAAPQPRAMASPVPRLPPVTRTTFPSRSMGAFMAAPIIRRRAGDYLNVLHLDQDPGRRLDPIHDGVRLRHGAGRDGVGRRADDERP